MAGPPRLLLIGSLPPPVGGTAVSFRQLARALRARSDVRIEVFDTSSGHGGLAPARRLRALATLVGAVRRADVVTLHVSTPGTVLVAPALLALCRCLRRPLLLREFGGSLDTDYERLSPLRRWLVRRALAADRVLLQTHHLVEHFERLLPGGRFDWYPNSRPVHPDAAAAPPPDGSDREARFVFVGHVKETKGLREILVAASRVDRCAVDVYGPLLDGFRADEFAASTRVVWKGELEPDDVVPALRRYDAVLLPTYHFGEGYPGIVLEAYAAGRPVVASRWRAIPEIVEDGVTGLLVEPRDADDLARAMTRLRDDPALRARLARGARDRARDFDARRWTDAFVEICRELADSAG